MDDASTGSQASFAASDDGFDENLHLEPAFDTFVCPLTKQVMKDPVTLENGQTFEREAIEKWFVECEKTGRKPVCPMTVKELRSTEVNPNIALRKTIKEWSLRNALIKLRRCCNSITPESSVPSIMRALKCIEDLQKRDQSYKNIVHKVEVIPMVAGFLRNGSRSVRCRALEVLCLLAEDDENKESLSYGDTLRTIVKFLYHELPHEREQAATLLCELSKSESMCKRIGEINGVVLILIGMASSTVENHTAIQKAEKTLEHLEKCENNVLQMAENGRLQPLIRLFLEGSPETQLTMASHLGDIVLSNDMKILVAQSTGPKLVDIMRSENILAKEIALKALNEISSYQASAKILIDAGILPPLVKSLFTSGNKQLPAKSKTFSATILANLVASGADFESLILGEDSKTLISPETIQSLLHLISNNGPTTACKLLQVLAGLTNSPTMVQQVVTAIKNSGAVTSLVQFIEMPKGDIRLEAIKVLHNISPFMSKDLSSALCSSAGLSKLVEIVTVGNDVHEEQIAAIGLLAELPDEDPLLVQCFLEDVSFNSMITRLLHFNQRKIISSRYSKQYFEGLARVIFKITCVLDYPNALEFAYRFELAVVFADLLQTNGFDNVQLVAAKALGNLSHQTRRLSQVPEPPKPGFCGMLCPVFVKKPETTGLCKVHGGICSLKGSFCLVDGGVVDRLVACLDHVNEKVIEAALIALCTLLEDGLNITNGAKALEDVRGIKPIIEILISKPAEPLHRKVIWALERLLRTESIALEISMNSKVRPALIDAYRHGDVRTKQIAEQALKSTEILPNFSLIY